MKKTCLLVGAFALATTVLLAGAARLDEGRASGVVPAVTMPMPPPAILGACIATGPGALICGGILVTGVLCYMYCDDIANWIMNMAGHKKGARPSTSDKHEEGDARRKRDQERAAKRGGTKGGKGAPKKPK